MKTIIAGSRVITNKELLEEAIKKSEFKITEVVSGNARGVDRMGEMWAARRDIKIKMFIPDWKTHGNKAAILRNCDMGDYADALIALWDGCSGGTKHMIDYATKKGLKVYIYNIRERNNDEAVE